MNLWAENFLRTRLLLESRNPLRQLMPRENSVFPARCKGKEAEVR